MPSERGIPPADQLLRLVSRAAGFATTSLDPADIMNGAVTGLARFLGARRADLWRLEGSELRWMAGSDDASAPPGGPSDLMRQVARAGLMQCLTLDEIAAQHPQWHKTMRGLKSTELGIYALATSDFSLGCLTVISDTSDRTQTYQDAMALYAEQVASALEKARLHRAAQRSAEQLEFQHRLLRDLADSRSVTSLTEVLGRQLRITDEYARASLLIMDSHGRAVAWNDSGDPGVPLSRAECAQTAMHASDYHAVDLRLGSTLQRVLNMENLDPTAALVIGLTRGGRPLGAFVGATTSTAADARSQLAEFLCSAAAATTIGLENALSFQRESKHASQLAHASTLATRMSTAAEEQELCDRLSEGVSELFHCRKSSVYTFQNGSLQRRSSTGNESTNFAEASLVDACAASGLPRRAELHNNSSHALPLIVRGERLGVLFVQLDESTAISQDDTDLQLLQTIADQAAGTLAVIAAGKQTEKSYKETIQSLLSALEASDQYTADHANDVANWAVEVGRRLGLTGTLLHDLELGAIFHDIGKIAIPNEILNKPGKLTDEEFEVMKTHTIAGEKIIAPIEFLQGVRPIVRHEHERWDGHGYPDGIAGEDIPLGSRIIFVCDAYHAITSDRPYRKARSDEVAKQILLENAGTQFDPAVVAVFLEVLDDFRLNVSSTSSPQRMDDEQAAA